MAYTRSHYCWVAIAPVRGVETISGGTQSVMTAAGLNCAWQMTAPCNVLGTGLSPYSLIRLGDDMYLFDREEYDPGQETWRKLAPGDPGQSHR
jgi:hypothetical protein